MPCQPSAFRSTLALLALALIPAACGPPKNPAGPREALAAYARAVEDGRVRDAYDMLSTDAKKSMPFDAFARMVKENPEEMRSIASALVRPSGTPAVTATVTTPEGKTLLLHYEDGRWRIDRSAIDLYAQDTPEAALAAFVLAFENKRYDVLLRFVPDAKKEGLDAARLKTAFEGEQKDEVERVTQSIRAALPTATIENLGDRATMSYGTGGTVELVREHGIWKVEEF
ncbi:MAG TPA: hypothetical protein VHE30_02150 [Polyangiaceae bacterium]|nr:hypothetical protein [Polyangiaceae bacterium]